MGERIASRPDGRHGQRCFTVKANDGQENQEEYRSPSANGGQFPRLQPPDFLGLHVMIRFPAGKLVADSDLFNDRRSGRPSCSAGPLTPGRPGPLLHAVRAFKPRRKSVPVIFGAIGQQKSLSGTASTSPQPLATTTGNPTAIASSTLFWMPRAMRNGATTDACHQVGPHIGHCPSNNHRSAASSERLAWGCD